MLRRCIKHNALVYFSITLYFKIKKELEHLLFNQYVDVSTSLAIMTLSKIENATSAGRRLMNMLW